MCLKNFLTVLLVMAMFDLSYVKAQECSQYFIDGATAYSEERYHEALLSFEKGAEKGDKYCCGRVAGCYFFGKGCDQNIPLSRKWAQKGYQLGNSYSAMVLGYTYVYEDSELGVSKAIPYFIYAYDAYDAEKENTEMYANMGLIIFAYMLKESKRAECIKWMDKVVNDYPNYTPVLGYVSLMYFNMDDYEKAIEYAIKADEGESLQGTFVLGWCMAHGKGIPKDEDTGFKKIRKAAMVEMFEYAMFALGECYYEGIGTPVNKNLAKEWFQKAANAGSEDAKEKLNLLFK